MKPRHIRRLKAGQRGFIHGREHQAEAWKALTVVERIEATTNIWFALVVRSQKERWVVEALRRNGLFASFTPLTSNQRRSTSKSGQKSFEVRNISRMPGYVFAALPKDSEADDYPTGDGEGRVVDQASYERLVDALRTSGDHPITNLRNVLTELSDHAGVIAALQTKSDHPFIMGYVGTSTGKPIRFSPDVVARIMALSKVPLYSDEEGATAAYRPAEPTEILLEGQPVVIDGTLLNGMQGILERIEDHEAVVSINGSQVFVPARNLRKQAI